MQTAISTPKGSVPARVDIQQTALDHCAAIGSKFIKSDDNVLPSVYHALSSDALGQMTDLVTQFWSDPSMTSKDAAERLSSILTTQ